VDLFGNFLAGPSVDGEAILVAEIDPAQIVRGKFDLDVVGHYARPDIFQLLVDEAPKQPVVREGSDLLSKGQKFSGTVRDQREPGPKGMPGQQHSKVRNPRRRT
jgi:hypothetical protein